MQKEEGSTEKGPFTFHSPQVGNTNATQEGADVRIARAVALFFTARKKAARWLGQLALTDTEADTLTSGAAINLPVLGVIQLPSKQNPDGKLDAVRCRICTGIHGAPKAKVDWLDLSKWQPHLLRHTNYFRMEDGSIIPVSGTTCTGKYIVGSKEPEGVKGMRRLTELPEEQRGKFVSNWIALFSKHRLG